MKQSNKSDRKRRTDTARDLDRARSASQQHTNEGGMGRSSTPKPDATQGEFAREPEPPPDQPKD